ncbi:type II toxin-antitoxin system TacA family antitoxin [Marinobacter sp. OP 3.4]|uniref:type II toxin-antitoxin system TacA family antitoxin n=1 Tax=Marinobacter sp. OP 3.4 TaxID=3076501 RepID=UPI002E1B6B00
MLTIPDNTPESRDRNTARFNFRTTERIKQTVEHAAAMLGQDTSTFAVTAAYERAIETIRSQEVTHLKPEDHQAFFEALEHPAEPTDKLRHAFSQHKEKVSKR